MKTTLTIEQSAELIKRGVSSDKASKRVTRQVADSRGREIEKLRLKRWKDCVPYEKATMTNLHIGLIRFEHKEIFTLADLFTMLPKGIIHNGLSCKLRITSWYDEPYFAGYMNQVGKYIMGNPYDAPFIAEELMDVIFQLLCWAIDNGHVKLD